MCSGRRTIIKSFQHFVEMLPLHNLLYVHCSETFLCRLDNIFNSRCLYICMSNGYLLHLKLKVNLSLT